MNNVPTVSDTKRAFYAAHANPISSIYRRVVEELLVEMHLLSVNSTFAYDPIFALGVISSYDRFMSSYRPEKDRESILNAICNSLSGALSQDVETFRRDASAIADAAQNVDSKTLTGWLCGDLSDAPEIIVKTIREIAERDTFKYSRIFGIGLFTLLERNNVELAQQKSDERAKLIQPIAEHLGLPSEKLSKDLDNYVSNLERMAQAKVIMEEAVEAERKKREKREQEQKNKATSAEDSSGGSEEPTQESTDKAASGS